MPNELIDLIKRKARPMLSRSVLFAAATLCFSLPALAADIVIEDPYMRSASPSAKTGAAFMQITNGSDTDDRLIAATSTVAQRTELHTHRENTDGVMRMIHVEEGFPIAAGEELRLDRGGKHVMLMGLNDALENGDVVTVTLTFEKAGDVTVEIPVDRDRAPKAHGGHGASDGATDGNHSGG